VTGSRSSGLAAVDGRNVPATACHCIAYCAVRSSSCLVTDESLTKCREKCSPASASAAAGATVRESYRASFEMGVLDGPYTVWKSDGVKVQGQNVDGLQQGTWRYSKKHEAPRA